uniref:PR domain zinc finger protein 8 n=1 Tax=Urocitellus parryii TaxID=9999 RepID=UPI000E55DCB4|nr:PR domain zinc finger protein 8 [Urocitellus parryii]
MEDSGIQRGIWDGDAKAVQQCLTDIFTSVYTTCDIPENAIFGPCVLSHTSLYDSIAFIALKSTDKRTVPYIFRVDTSAANGSSEGLMWLRLVQSARDKEEQNLEAYIKNGQLFYRSLRRIAKDEELLVWYGKELTELLLLCPSRSHNKMNGTPQQYRASGSYFSLEENGRLFAPPSPETGEAKRSAFVEVKKAGRGAGLQEEATVDGGSTTAEDHDAGGGGGSSTPAAASPAGAEKLLAPRPGGPLPSRLEGGSPARGSAFTSVPQLGASGGNGAGGGAGSAGSGSAGGGQGAASDERKSAFSQPARSFSQLSPLVLGQKLGALEPCHPGDGVGPTRLYPAAADPLAVKLQGAADLNGGCRALQTGGGSLPKQSPFLYATAFWPKSSAAAAAAAAAAAGPLQLQLPSALTLLPPSFTSLCLPAQNWCAKCNASFRMTSDLVYHMRSHHKKEYAMEPLVKRRREEKLKCPICNESFRERHHLSRHMTSHN